MRLVAQPHDCPNSSLTVSEVRVRLDHAEHPESVTLLEVVTQDTRPGNSHYSLISNHPRLHFSHSGLVMFVIFNIRLRLGSGSG